MWRKRGATSRTSSNSSPIIATALGLQILYHRPRSKRHLTYNLIRELAQAMESSAYHLAPAEVWKCYARLRADKVKTPEPGDALTNLISLVRFATGQQAELSPFPELARQRFQDG